MNDDEFQRELERDLQLYGVAYEWKLPDGRRRSIDPTTMIVHRPKTENDGPSPLQKIFGLSSELEAIEKTRWITLRNGAPDKSKPEDSPDEPVIVG